MWLIQNLYGFIIIGLIAIALFIFYSEKCASYFYTLKLKYMIGSFTILEITNKEQSEEACASLKSHCQDFSALGFDCEWISENEKRRPVALVQLASFRGLCCLFRLNILGGVPNELKEILYDTNIIKLGLCPLSDSKHLIHDYNVEVRSTLDLKHLYPNVGGLASLASSVIGIKLNKSLWIKCSNWESPKLTSFQKDYAAKDALVAIEIFKKWLKTNSKPKFEGKSSSIYGELLNGDLKLTISRYLDVQYKAKNTRDSLSKFSNNKTLDPIKSNKLKLKYVTRKTPLYHNIFMHAPNGELLCSCDKRKAEWYLERGLAEVMPGEPFSIKLLFKPSKGENTTEEALYYKQLKQNCCVVCGNEESYLRHNVVPKEYRKHFPNIMKDHQSHDIVLVCINCHQLISQHDVALKQKLAVMCNATPEAKVTCSGKAQKIRNNARALLNSGDVIPIERKNQLENSIRNYFKIDDITPEVLENAAKLETGIINDTYESHGSKVVKYFNQEDGGLIKLEKLWREHFLETMKPQYLPARWSVSHNHSRVVESLMKKRD